jgi:uncharacterized membrane protein YbhN (UPF0104 family)
MPPHLRWILRVLVSAVVLLVLLALVPIGLLSAAIARAPTHVLLAALLLFVAGHSAAAFKWRLLQGQDCGLPMLTILRAHFAGVVANLWLPGVIGGDVVRAGLALRQANRRSIVAIASLADRLVDSLGLLLLATVGLYLAGAPARGAREIIMAMAAAFLAGAGVAGLACWYLKTRSTSARARHLLEAVNLIGKRPGLVATAVAISIGVQVTFILVNASLGEAVGMTAPFSAWLMAWPLAKLAALLPISAAGIGVREAALVALLHPFGDSAEAILAAGLLWQGVFIAGGLIGWGALLFVPSAPAAGGQRLQPSRE